MKLTSRSLMVVRAVVVLSAMLSSAAVQWLGAQTPQPPVPVEGSLPGEKHVAPRRGFNLFATADLAASGMRGAGQFYWAVSNIGPCADGHTLYGDGIGCGGHTGAGMYEVVLSAGVPLTDFQKIRAVHDDARYHLGPQGFTELSTHLRVGGGSQDWGPADNSFGKLFSGIVSTSDGSCRDNTQRRNNFMGTNITLLAGSDCPETWPATGFDGPRNIGDSAFIRLKQRQGSAFTFDWFRVPAAERSSRFLGTFSTYGEISDHFAEALESYGRVTPKGADRDPTRNGFPLGLDVRFEAFSFGKPALANAVFWQMIVVNNSKDVYGVGIDYDSLYMGFMQGIGIGSDANPSQYALPHRNAILMVRSGVHIGCNGATPSLPGVGGCANSGFRTSHGSGVLMLKSPIGDTRNKLLSRPGPFYDPSSPYADDTITFNHHHQCGFGLNCFGSTTGLNDRRGFGMISSTEENVLDGRVATEITLAQQWATFRPKAHPAPGNARFNRYVPGTWSYENKVRPPVLSPAQRQDTLFFDSCEGTGFLTIPNQNGGRPLPSCSVAFSDTMPGKQTNSGPGNIGGVMTAGPFPLRAGDSTSFIISWFAERDSIGLEALTDRITQEYLRFFAGPAAPPAPTIGGAEVASAQERQASGQQPVVRLFFSDDPETAVDSHFTRFAQDVRTSPDPYFRRLRILNAALADSIDRAASNNLAELLIFRSCDNGRTFTTRASCAPALGARLDGPNQPYATIRANASGEIPNTWTDSSVVPGITYLYSLVPRSRGLTVGVIDVDPTDRTAACLADTTYTACRKVGNILAVADTMIGAIATEGPSTAKVYVPISLPSGGRAPSALTSTRAGSATLPIEIALGQRVTAGDYRSVFGNRFIVQQTTNTVTNATTSVVRVQSLIPSATRAGVNFTDFVEREIILAGDGPIDITGATYAPTIGTGVGTRVETDTISGLGFVLARGNQPLFLTLAVNANPLAPTTPPSFLRREDFPGFILSVDQRQANVLRQQVLRPNGDSIPLTAPTYAGVDFRPPSGSRLAGRGQYTFTFVDDPFGHGPSLTLGNSASIVASAFSASIAGRNVGAVGDTSARIRALAALFPFTAASARPIRFPFTVTSATGNPVILVGYARTAERRLAGPDTGTFLLGSGSDTLRVPADSLFWLPGDAFAILEIVENDSVNAGRVVLDPLTNERVKQTDTVVSFLPARLGCRTPRIACNPLSSGRGATGYLRYEPDTRLIINYPIPFTAMSDVDIRVNGPVPLADLSSASLNSVRVIPNPFVLRSQYQVPDMNGRGEPRIMFSGLPARGVLRIYSVSGQFLQQLTWQPGELEGEGSGDLHWNLRARGGGLVASGLYVYVITAHDERGRQVNARGKFVIIR
jgi:hypothetical protein